MRYLQELRITFSHCCCCRNVLLPSLWLLSFVCCSSSPVQSVVCLSVWWAVLLFEIVHNIFPLVPVVVHCPLDLLLFYYWTSFLFTSVWVTKMYCDVSFIVNYFLLLFSFQCPCRQSILLFWNCCNCKWLFYSVVRLECPWFVLSSVTVDIN